MYTALAYLLGSVVYSDGLNQSLKGAEWNVCGEDKISNKKVWVGMVCKKFHTTDWMSLHLSGIKLNKSNKLSYLMSSTKESQGVGPMN